MGNYFTVNMEENFKNNQEFIQNINKIKMERQIQLQHQLQERQMAMTIAKNRDTCLFRRTKRPYLLMPLIPLTFTTLYYWDLAYGNKIHRIRMEAEHIMTHEADYLEMPFRRTKRPYLLMPLIPLTFTTLYYWDLAYGNKIHRIRMEAEHIMTHEADYLEMPCGLPTPSSIDLGRLDAEEKKKIHPPLL
ncbi:Transmembrane protein-like protein [Operophtera brumata]|uniref:Transmembrane protein-like protein n=1 Tax=Operophtera brumata TaxID=104452 RepID=A0A0L7L0Q3_OPEBR|nr:Transmembrane protein-like protein [Operophtera brumata]